MDYEKKYKNALEWARQVMNGETGFIRKEVEEVFPELKESEDERIRKELIEFFTFEHWDGEAPFSAESARERIAWLEKQGKNMGISEATKQKLKDNLNKALEKETPESWSEFLEKQGEQKSTDKVEPKFHKGDWVISPNGVYWHIDAINNNRYEVSSTDGTYADWPLNTTLYNLWTIQDAKDGDVLVNQNGEMPFIFKECKDNHIYCYCGYTNRKDIFFDGFVDSEGEELHWLNLYHEQVYPATKEQRELLFQKMKEAGYEWDAEKKELKKIEDEEYDGEDYGIDSLWHAKNILEKTLGKVNGYQTDDGILEHKCAISAVKKLYEQTPAWSEEDEMMLGKCINAASGYYSPEDKQSMKDWLYRIKDRIQPQQKQEWGEEDSNMLQSILDEYKSMAIEKRNWLKSLKDRYTWKPSEGQLECLGYAIEKAEKDWFPLTNNRIYLTLKILKEQLEKL